MAEETIRLRILKVIIWQSGTQHRKRGRGNDPVEDTERLLKFPSGLLECCGRGNDPVEDTEREVRERIDYNHLMWQRKRSG